MAVPMLDVSVPQAELTRCLKAAYNAGMARQQS